MIAKPQWFERRKYGGWGLHPKTKEGWIYIAFILLPLIGFHLIPIWNDATRVAVTIAWTVFILVDTMEVMFKIKKDERERLHEALAERNALYGILVVLVIAILYQLISSGLKERIYVDPFVAAALIIGVAIKGISNYYYDNKD